MTTDSRELAGTSEPDDDPVRRRERYEVIGRKIAQRDRELLLAR